MKDDFEVSIIGLSAGHRTNHMLPKVKLGGDMIGGIEILFLAMVTFVGGHFILGQPKIRSTIVARVGEKGFQGMFIIVLHCSAPYRTLAADRLDQLDPQPRRPDFRRTPCSR